MSMIEVIEAARPRVMVAPNGARRRRADHPALPERIDEIAEVARACHEAGAGALHLHVRDAEGRHSLDAGLYRAAIAAVRAAAPDMAIQITTEAAGIYAPAEQLACLAAVQPEWASVALREMEADAAVAARLHGLAAEIGTRVQHILYEPDQIGRLLRWQADGIVGEGPLEAIFVLGRYQGPPVEAVPGDLDAFLAAPGAERLDWTVCAFGRNERACLIAALGRGGRARIGFENNIHHPNGRVLQDNAQSVRLLVEAMSAGQGPRASASEERKSR
jgi:uncharacterized protein (DUF849 family)